MGRAFEYRRATKEKRWGTMSKIFPKLAKAVTIAAKEGGPDPEMNAKLRAAIQNAKAQNMPKDNIDSAIKRASGKNPADITELSYEGKGPHGVLFFIECATDNANRTIANIKSYFSKAGGSIVPSGSLEFMFERKAVFKIPQSDEIDLEQLEFDLIDAGLEEIETEEEAVFVYGDYTNFGTLSSALEEMNIEVTRSSLKHYPTTPVALNDEQMEEVEKLLGKIEDDEDVQAAYTNIE